MIIVIAIISLLDSMLFPVRGILPVAVFIFVVMAGVINNKIYKQWFTLSLVFIVSAVFVYMFLDPNTLEKLIHKLSDWSLIFLLIGLFRLARHTND